MMIASQDPELGKKSRAEKVLLAVARARENTLNESRVKHACH
jgi:hypothetical protein